MIIMFLRNVEKLNFKKEIEVFFWIKYEIYKIIV